MVVQLQIASYICQTFTTEPENIKNKELAGCLPSYKLTFSAK